MSEPTAPLPPGRTGLPFLGEVLEFLRDGFGFVEQRARRHGPVFRTRLLGRETAVITGAAASGEFINTEHVVRSGAMLPHVRIFFGGNALPTLDGDAHLERKRAVLAAFTREALAAYLPVMQRVATGHMERWAAAPEVALLEGFKRLALDAICATVMGLEGERVDRLARDYELLGHGFASVPIPLPGTAYTRARHAVARILALFGECIAEHAAQPRDDGLSRMLAFVSPTTGQRIAPADVAVELHHVVVAGLIVWAWFVTAVEQLERNAGVRDRLEAEIRALAPSGPLALEALHRMTYLDQFVDEVRRTSPVVHVFFGRARETFEFQGHRIPAGWMVLWGHRSSHMRPEDYPDPERFDPDRFGPGRREHEKAAHAFVPNGAGPPTGHKCAGFEFAPLLLKVVTVELLRGFTVQPAAAQDRSIDWSRVPPAPRGGLRATVRRR